MARNVAAIVLLIGIIAWAIVDPNGVSDETTDAPADETTASVPTGLEQGHAAPDFALKTIDGEEVKLSDFRGKRVLLNMWASWCPPCREEIPAMQRFYEDHHNDDVVILGVNLTTSERRPETIPKFVEAFGMTFPVVLDDQSAVTHQYRVISIPTSYMIDSRGVIQHKIIGPLDTALMREMVLSME